MEALLLEFQASLMRMSLDLQHHLFGKIYLNRTLMLRKMALK